MAADKDILIAEIPSADEDARIAVFLRTARQESALLLCQQSWADGIGWFTQSSVEIEPGQLDSLRRALGGTQTSKTFRPANPRPSHSLLRVVG